MESFLTMFNYTSKNQLGAWEIKTLSSHSNGTLNSNIDKELYKKWFY